MGTDWLPTMSSCRIGGAPPLVICAEDYPSLGASVPYIVQLTALVPVSLFPCIHSTQQHVADGSEISWIGSDYQLYCWDGGGKKPVNTRSRRPNDRLRGTEIERRGRRGEEENGMQDNFCTTSSRSWKRLKRWSENEFLTIYRGQNEMAVLE